eukprot:1478083-Alexandrium_andersonii.AAC.1
MLATAWSTVSSCKRPLQRTGRARIALDPRSLMTKTVKEVSLPSFVRKQLSIATSGAACSPGTELTCG